jgi:hypothetical protein
LGEAGVIGASDVLCLIPGSAAGPDPVAAFTGRLDQSTTARFDWIPNGSQVFYLLLAVPLDGSAPAAIPVAPGAAIAVHDTGGVPACYTIFSVHLDGTTSSAPYVCTIPGGSVMPAGAAAAAEELARR